MVSVCRMLDMKCMSRLRCAHRVIIPGIVEGFS
jgi:hypothetical protein